jgi:hypothetical protein
MKYKLIKSMAHNWTYSFMSCANIIDGDPVFADVHRLARERRGQKVILSWIPERPEELLAHTPRVREAFARYRPFLAEHMRRHQVLPEAIAEMRIEVYVSESHRMYVRSCVLDDRGKEYTQFVWAS